MEKIGLQRIKKIIRGIGYGLEAVFVTLLCGVSVLLCGSISWMFDTWKYLNMDELMYQLNAPITGTNEGNDPGLYQCLYSGGDHRDPFGHRSSFRNEEEERVSSCVGTDRGGIGPDGGRISEIRLGSSGYRKLFEESEYLFFFYR